MWCRVELPLAQITMDHVIPRSWGGLNASVNLVPACRMCNASRGAAPASIWLDTYVNPDRQAIEDAVEAVLELCKQLGKPTGRVALELVELRWASTTVAA